ncbi:MAG: hypothetical protein O2955_16020 [Planctomycetota bacterium]|nr:hypothetical protein [Planctomycetota bacterium]MDA1214022.1 hypothetical protein [Planctomycetota bacterium]
MSKAQVAALSADRITCMTSPELVDAIISADLPRLSSRSAFDVDTNNLELLRSLALRARNVCRQQGY